MEKQLQQGQALLIVVLVMVVALTVGLSIASRSITNLRISTDDENSQRAFSAAEAGVERLIKSDCTGLCTLERTTLGNESSFEGTVRAIRGDTFIVKGGVQIKQNEGSDIWLSKYSTDPSELYTNQWSGNLTIYWGETGTDCSNAALEVMVLTGSKANPTLSRYAYDPCSRGNNFSSPGSTTVTPVSGKQFKYNSTIAITNGLLMRVIPLYTNTTIAIRGDSALPIQGQEIESIGEAGGTVRKVTFIQSYASLPSEFFQYVLLSQQ